MDIRPVDLPELRAEIVRLRTDIGVDGIRTLQPDSVIADRLGISKSALIELETWKVSEATLFHASREMTDLATSAAASLPPFALDAEDFPAEYGLIYFDGGIAADWGGHPVKIYIVSWQVLTGFGASIAYYTDAPSFCSTMLDPDFTEAVLRRRGARGDGLWPSDIVRSIAAFISEQDERYGETEGVSENGIAVKVMPVLRAALLLMQQPLTKTSIAEADRASRKRLRRSDIEPSLVRVIELRRPKVTSEPAGGDREYHHRWITRGHWRQQWYPAREVHRPVWIAPHIKGPEGAPLLGGEKVYAWKR